MSIENVIDLFIEHKLIKKIKSEHKDMLEDFEDDIELGALELLSEVASDKIIEYSLARSEDEIHKSFGESCTPDELIEEFTKDFDEVSEVSKGKVKVVDLKISPPLNEMGRVDKDKEMSISFISDNKNYEWKFSLYDDENYVEGFAKWLFEVFDGDFLFFNDDYPFGYNIPKGLISELEGIGVENQIHDLM